MKDNVVIALVGVNSYHVSNCISTYRQLQSEGYTLRVLTNRPDLFEPQDVYVYNRKIFTYLDKLFFCLELVEEYNCSVLSLDSDKYYEEHRIRSFIEKSQHHQITYQGSWPGGNFDAYKDINPCFKYLKEYCEYRGIEYKNWKTIWEYAMFFRDDIDYQAIKYELETIAPVFTYMSLMNKDTYDRTPFALGGAEGLALSIVLDKLGIESQEVLI
jgi:hypothetical protein